MRVARERLLRGRRAIEPSEQFYLFGWVNWGGFRGRGLLGNNSKNNQIIGTRKKFAECGLLGNNSNLVIRWRVWGCIFSLIIEIVLRGGTILIAVGRFGVGCKLIL